MEVCAKARDASRSSTVPTWSTASPLITTLCCLGFQSSCLSGNPALVSTFLSKGDIHKQIHADESPLFLAISSASNRWGAINGVVGLLTKLTGGLLVAARLIYQWRGWCCRHTHQDWPHSIAGILDISVYVVNDLQSIFQDGLHCCGVAVAELGSLDIHLACFKLTLSTSYILVVGRESASHRVCTCNPHSMCLLPPSLLWIPPNCIAKMAWL